MRQFAVIGLGRFGMTVAETLAKKGAPVLAIDSDPDVIERVKDMVSDAVQMDSTDESALRQSGVLDVDVVVVSIGECVEASILTTALLKRMGAKMIVARANSDIHGQILKLVGADRVVYPEYDEGVRIANTIFLPSILERVEFPGGITLTEMRAPKKFVGKTLSELQLRTKYGINVVFFKREGAKKGEPETRFVPKPDYRISKDDIMVIVGDTKAIESLHQK